MSTLSFVLTRWLAIGGIQFFCPSLRPRFTCFVAPWCCRDNIMVATLARSATLGQGGVWSERTGLRLWIQMRRCKKAQAFWLRGESLFAAKSIGRSICVYLPQTWSMTLFTQNVLSPLRRAGSSFQSSSNLASQIFFNSYRISVFPYLNDQY